LGLSLVKLGLWFIPECPPIFKMEVDGYVYCDILY